MYDGLTDNQLVALYRSGKTDAFDDIYSRYARTVKSISRSYFLLGGDGDDVAQEGLMGLLKAANTFDESAGASFRTFATMCITSNIKTAIRLASGKNNSPLNNAVGLEDGSGAAVDTEELVIDNENKRELTEKIAAVLSPLESEIFRLYLEGMSYRDIAAETGKTYKGVDSAVQRIKKKLYDLFATE